MKFEELKIQDVVLKGIKDAGYETATIVQEKSLPVTLAGKDLMVQSKTGSGKTAAFAIPLLNKIQNFGIEAIILVPTRELAMQVCVEVETLGKHTKIRALPVYGGTDIDRQIRNLHGRSIIVATPGRFIDLFKRGHLNLKTVKFVVLDEADRMLDMGFDKDIEYILSHVPKERQTLLFSATMPEPIQKIAHRYMRHPEKIFLSQDKVDTTSISQSYYGVAENRKIETLAYILDNERPELAIVFCRTKRGVDWLENVLNASGFRAIALHGDLTQSRRDRVVEQFKKKHVHVLVASDVAARGLDIDDVSHVINFDLPDDPNVYIHRIGRTGRAGKTGKAISIVTTEDNRTLEGIERKIRHRLTREHIDQSKPKPQIRIPARTHSFHRARGKFGNERRRPGGRFSQRSSSGRNQSGARYN